MIGKSVLVIRFDVFFKIKTVLLGLLARTVRRKTQLVASHSEQVGNKKVNRTYSINLTGIPLGETHVKLSDRLQNINSIQDRYLGRVSIE